MNEIKTNYNERPILHSFVFGIIWSLIFLTASAIIYQQYPLLSAFYPVTVIMTFTGWIPFILEIVK